jgi:hypothetical protein
MTKFILKAINVTNSHIIYIFILAVTGIYLPSWPLLLVSCFGLVLSLVIFPVIYGRFIDILERRTYSSFSSLLQKHWLNFWLVSLLLVTPFIVVGIIGATLKWEFPIYFLILSITVIEVLSIYIYPLVFLKHQGISSIPLGIRILFSKFRQSMPLVFLCLIILMIDLLRDYIEKALSVSIKINPFALLSISLVHVFINSYIMIIIFLAASKFLLEQRSLNKPL